MSTVMSAPPMYEQAVPNQASPAAGPGGPHVTPSGRLRDPGVASDDRTFAVWTHIGPLIVLVLGSSLLAAIPALVLWLIRKDKSPFVDDHGREAMNFQLSCALWSLLLFWTIVVPIALWIVGIVGTIRGAVAAGNGEYFRYPLTIRFI